MDKLYAIEAFLKIVDSGSITAAADAMDVSQPAMVRTLAALERELGVRLLNRTTRRMSLTDEGREYYERGRHIAAAVEDAQQQINSRRATPRGRLRIASSVPFGRLFVAPVVAEFLAVHPEMNVELLLLDRIVDLVEEGMDVAVRIARLPDSSLVAHALGDTRRVIVASPALLRSDGLPKKPDDLRGRRCVTFTGVASPGSWSLRDGRKRVAVPIKSALTTNQIDAAVQACVQGTGYGQFFDYHVLAEIKAGRLTRILQKYEDEAIPASLVYPSARHLSPNVRSFSEFAQPRIRAALKALQQA